VRLRTTKPKPERTTSRLSETELYRLFDANGRLLYVGISLSAVARLKQHEQTKHWSNSIARVEVERFSSRSEACRAEAKAILAENPAHNVVRPRRAQ
jgi:predicted GIY-YIG superfamily endonuclease